MNTSDYAKIIAKNLKRIAYEHGRTQADIARDLQINKQTVSSWMSGKRTPRMDKIDLLCHYFNVSRADIMEPYEPEKESYYYDPETVKKAQELFDNPGMRILFDAARDSKPEDLQMAADLLARLKGTNPNG